MRLSKNSVDLNLNCTYVFSLHGKGLETMTNSIAPIAPRLWFLNTKRKQKLLRENGFFQVWRGTVHVEPGTSR